jgi:allophanate hydrolase subunit 2
MAGPQGEFFTAAGWETFLGTDWVVSPRSDRMGCRLDGPAIEHADGFNIVSDGIVEGSIQVPGSGLPIVLLVDRQSTGGYAKIATVIGADLGAFAQVRPGDVIRFERVDDETAVKARRDAHEAFERTLRRIAPLRDTGPPDVGALFAANLAGGAVSATADPFD